MQHAGFENMPCPIARGLDRVGEWWTILILRDAFHGKTRFDQFQRSLGIAPNILARRLRALIKAGLLEKIRYTERPPRDDYVLTAVGQDFRPVLSAMLTWGNKHFKPDGQRMPLINTVIPSDTDLDARYGDEQLNQTMPRSVSRPTQATASRSTSALLETRSQS